MQKLRDRPLQAMQPIPKNWEPSCLRQWSSMRRLPQELQMKLDHHLTENHHLCPMKLVLAHRVRVWTKMPLSFYNKLFDKAGRIIEMIKKSFRIFAVPLFQDNYSYIVQTSIKDPLMLVDPANPEVIMDCLNRYFNNQPVGHILYTHKHWDHAGGSEDLFKILNSKDQRLEVYSGVEDAIHIKTVTQQIQGDEELHVGATKIRVYKVPCHTKGHVVYHLLQNQSVIEDSPKSKASMETSEGKKIHIFEEVSCAFTGDTLFCGGIGKFFEGNANEMFMNIKKIHENLPSTCSIFCGHEYTLANMKWGAQVEPENNHISKFISQIEEQDPALVCTLPTSTKRESQVNVFYRAVTNNENKLNVEGVEYLRILREAKNNNSVKLEDYLQKN